MRVVRQRRSIAPVGFALSEMLVGVLIFSSILLALLYMWTADGDDDAVGIDVSPYRVANAIYAHGLLEGYRVAVMQYVDMHGYLPGDTGAPANATGRGDWRIEREYGEDKAVFEALARAGVVPRGTLRVRGRELAFFWATLMSGEEGLQGANYFVLRGFNRDEARAMDWKFDDGRNNDGNILYAIVDDDVVDLYYKLELSN